jgi:GT2 family glycosyltransferase
MKNPKLSIIILNYNTKDLLLDCLKSLEKVRDEISFEIIVVDNGSSDGSQDALRKLQIKLIENSKNLGFARGNNAARKVVKGEYILFLNSDTIVNKNVLKETVANIDDNTDVGAITCKTVLSDGSLDNDARRSFPTPWVSFTHLVLPLDKLFPKSKVFAKYWYGYKSPDETHEIDAIQGAFFLTRKKILDEVGWFDEDYFLDGEDIDLSWKIKNKGYKNVYYPKVSIIHLKGATKGKNKKTKSNVSLKEKIKYRMSGVNSMEIFYKKRMWKNYPLPLNLIVLSGIKMLKVMRITKLIIFD